MLITNRLIFQANVQQFYLKKIIEECVILGTRSSFVDIASRFQQMLMCFPKEHKSIDISSKYSIYPRNFLPSYTPKKFGCVSGIIAFDPNPDTNGKSFTSIHFIKVGSNFILWTSIPTSTTGCFADEMRCWTSFSAS